MADKRAKNGGAREGAGRKKKSEEEKAKRLSLSAIKKIFGSEESAFEYAATRAMDVDDKEAFKYFQFLMHHAYGKPVERNEITGDGTGLIINVSRAGDKD